MRLATRGLSFGALLTCLVLSSITAGAADDEGFVKLFNGKNLDGFAFVLAKKDADPSKTWMVKDGVIHCTGKPNGYFHTKKSFRNYILRLDFRYPEKAGNSGYLIHISGPHKVWPKCIEVQGHYNSVCSIFAIGGAKGERPPVDKKALEKARKPHTEWNTVQIVSKDGMLTSYLNGVKICANKTPYELKEGPIGFQSEGVPIEFRNIMIKELK
ncbi:MAG: hypothetical protein KatS3mg105_1297 [Gemmatales bacterium]|nr:MAG: hypothetical protein KatS3mg105_1297 [Gemmatales bacterium]